LLGLEKKNRKKPTGILILSYKFGVRVQAPPQPKQKQMVFGEGLDGEDLDEELLLYIFTSE